MSNADFYNNIKEKAASMENAYPELSHHITRQSSSNKKYSRENHKGYNNQTNTKENKKPSINPAMIISRTQNKSQSSITINKERLPSATISSPSMTAVRSDKNKNQSDKSNDMRIVPPNKLNLNPSLIKVRSRSSEIEQKTMSEEQALPPGFGHPKNENKITSSGKALTITLAEKKDKDKDKDKDLPVDFSKSSFSYIELPPAFRKSKNDDQQSDLNSPPGFTGKTFSIAVGEKKEEEKTHIEKEAAINPANPTESNIEPPPGFGNSKNGDQQSDLNSPPGFSGKTFSITVGEKKEEEKTHIEKEATINPANSPESNIELPPGFGNSKNGDQQSDLNSPPGFSGKTLSITVGEKKEEEKAHIEKEAAINPANPTETNIEFPPGFVNLNSGNQQTDLNTPPGFSGKSFTITTKENKEEAEKEIHKESEQSTNQGNTIIESPAIFVENEKEYKLESLTKEQYDKSEIEEKNQFSKVFKVEDKGNNNENSLSTQSNQESKQEADNVSANPKENDNINPIQHFLNPMLIQQRNTSSNQQLEIPATNELEIKETPANKEVENKENTSQSKFQEVNDTKMNTMPEIQEPIIQDIPVPEIISFQEPKMSDIPEHIRSEFDYFGPDSDISDSRFGYEEEEEEEEEIERNIILPSQLVAQPLEIELRKPKTTSINVEIIDTMNPFASYEDIDNRAQGENGTSNSSQNQYINYDSSLFPSSYGINDNLSYAFHKNAQISVFELTTHNFQCLKPGNVTAITAKGDFIVTAENGQIQTFKIEKKIIRSRTTADYLHDVTSFVADPIDPNRFFYFISNEHKLYILLTNKDKAKPKLIADDVLSFDVSSKYLLIVSSIDNNVVVRCITRKDGSLFDLWQKPIKIKTINSPQDIINSDFFCCITDEYYIEKVANNVTIYESDNLNTIQSLSHVAHIFKGGEIPLFLLSNGGIVHYRQIYHFPRPIICAVANKKSIIAWHSLSDVPYISEIKGQAEKQTVYNNKHQLKQMYSTITKKTREYLKEFPAKLTQKVELFNCIDNCILQSKAAIERFNTVYGEMADIVKSMTPTVSVIDSCFESIEKKQFEAGFSNALNLEKKDFVIFLTDKRVESIFNTIRSINDNNDNDNSEKIGLTDGLLKNLVAEIIKYTEIDSLWMLDKLVHLLLALPDDKRMSVLAENKNKVDIIIQEYGAGIKEENTLKNFDLLKQLVSNGVE